MNFLSNLPIIGKLIEMAGTALAFLFAYRKGSDDQKLKQLAKDRARKKKELEIEEDNLRKSNVTILSELRDKYSRSKKR